MDKRKLLKRIKLFIEMARNDVGIQIVIIIMLIGFFYWLAVTNLFINFPQLNVIIQAYKMYFIAFAGALGLIPVSNLILQMISKDGKNHDDKPYYAILKGISHLIFSSIIILIFAVFLAYSWLYLMIWFDEKFLSLIISATLILIMYNYLWKFLEKKFGLKSFGFFSYVKG